MDGIHLTMDKNQGESGNERDAYREGGGEGGEGRGEDGEGNVSMARYERFPTEGAGWNDEMGLKWLLKRHA